VDPADVDILMGTFTKSFGAVGGYVAGSVELIDYLKTICAGYVYSSSISPPAAQQVISAMKIIMGVDGTDIGQKKLAQLRDNCNYFRQRLKAMGCIVLGDENSPVCPLLLFHPSAINSFSMECFRRGLAVVVVAYPATSLLLGRSRMCISAGHHIEDLKAACDILEEVTAMLGFQFHGKRPKEIPLPLSRALPSSSQQQVKRKIKAK